jgi:hypothetical protein
MTDVLLEAWVSGIIELEKLMWMLSRPFRDDAKLR